MTHQELFRNILKKKSFLCVGLDTDIKKLPDHLNRDYESIFEFNKAIIDATAPYCVAFKPNLAFYEYLGPKGWEIFERTVRYIRDNYPDQFIIADAKRGDIGNTSSMYARAFYEYYDVDAVTIAPYMGHDSISPFLNYPGKWAIILDLTSNKGSADFQLIENAEGRPLYENVLEICKKLDPDNSGIMFVVGATQGERLSNIREIVPDAFLLVPGIGAQGGSLEEVVKHGLTRECGLIVNASRSILYASSRPDFAVAAANEAKKVADEMGKYLKDYGLL